MEEPTLLHSLRRNAARADSFLLLSDQDASFSEINNRISNNLALLASTVSMRAASFSRRERPIPAHEVTAALREITARIVAVGHLHSLLATRPHGANARFGAHMRELCRLFVSALAAPGQVELIETGTNDCTVGADDFLPLSLIVTEVVTNALKHAHPAGAPGKLMIGCRRKPGGSIFIEVADDGVGLPERFDFSADAGTGLRTIDVLAQQIGAKTSFESRAIGLRFTLRLPATDGDDQAGAA